MIMIARFDTCVVTCEALLDMLSFRDQSNRRVMSKSISIPQVRVNFFQYLCYLNFSSQKSENSNWRKLFIILVLSHIAIVANNNKFFAFEIKKIETGQPFMVDRKFY